MCFFRDSLDELLYSLACNELHLQFIEYTLDFGFDFSVFCRRFVVCGDDDQVTFQGDCAILGKMA